MLLPRTAEYALRCMAEIALLPKNESISAANLYELVEVPRLYLSKVLRKLVAAGLLTAERGHGGGFKLSRPPAKISFLEILNASGFTFVRNHCVAGWGQCNARNPCPLHEAFSKLSSETYEWASKTTLADIEANPARHKKFRRTKTSEKAAGKATFSRI